jgi:hypothetical protein
MQVEFALAMTQQDHGSGHTEAGIGRQVGPEADLEAFIRVSFVIAPARAYLWSSEEV